MAHYFFRAPFNLCNPRLCSGHATPVVLPADDGDGTADSVERLTGPESEARFAFISDKAELPRDDLRWTCDFPKSGRFCRGLRPSESVVAGTRP